MNRFVVICGFVVFILTNNVPSIAQRSTDGDRRSLLIEAESFEGVANVSSFDAASPWSLAGAAGMNGLKTTASGGEAIYAGAFTPWANGTDCFIARTIELDSPGSYDIYVRTYRDGKDRAFRVRVFSKFFLLTPSESATEYRRGMERGETGTALKEKPIQSGFYWEKIGTFDLEDQQKQSITIEISKVASSHHVAVCDAIFIAGTGTPLEQKMFVASTLWDEDADPLENTSGSNIAEHGSAEKWQGTLPVGWALHVDHESPTLEKETSAQYVTDGTTAVKVNTTRPYTGILFKVSTEPNSAYQVAFDTALTEGKAKLMLSTTTEIHMDHVPMPPGGPITSKFNIVTGSGDKSLSLYLTSTTIPKTTFYADNVKVTKIADVKPDYRVRIPNRKDILKRRYPHYPSKNPRTSYPEIELREDQGSIILESEFARMVFDSQTGSISNGWLRGRNIQPISLPETCLVDNSQNEYLQRYARNSQLKWNHSKDGSYYEIHTRVIPRSADGDSSPIGFDCLYRIHKRVGIVLVYAKAFTKDEHAKVQRLSFRNGLGDTPEMEVNHLAYYNHAGPPRYPKSGQPTFEEISSHHDEVVYSDHITSATWTNGAIGIQVMANRMAGSQIHERFLNDPKTLKYFAIRTRDGQRAVDYVAIHQPIGQAVSIEPDTTFTYAFNLLPIHRHRPRIEFMSSGMIGYMPMFGGATIPPESEIRELARLGADYAYLSYPPGWGLNAPQVDQFRLQNITNLLHRYGMKAWLGGVTTPNSGQHFVDWGWMKHEEVTHGMFMDILRPEGHRLEAGWPEKSGVWMCMNDHKFREEVLLKRMVFDVVDQYDQDAAYLDIHTPLPCGNPLHGCQSVTVPIEGNIAFLESFHRKMKKEGTTAKVFAGHSGWAFNTAYSLMDYTLPGEFDLKMPGKTMLNTVWTSMLFGIQCQFYTGEMDVSSPEFYDKVMSRGSIAYIFLVPDRFSQVERRLWVQYMTPLKIFDVENSMLHHPFDGDYSQYASGNTQDLFPLIYRRPGDVLLVVTKEKPELQGRTVTLNLKAEALGLKDDVLVFDIHGKKIASTRVGEDKELKVTIELAAGPSMLRIMNQPETPVVIWHDQVVWQVNRVAKDTILAVGGTRDRLSVKSEGVPLSTGTIYLWCSNMGEPQAASDRSELLGYDATTKMAAISVNFSGKADNYTLLQY